jgi:hypothetical protein
MLELLRRIAALFRSRSMGQELAEELQFHLEMKARETGEEAAAKRAVGNALAWRERACDVSLVSPRRVGFERREMVLHKRRSGKKSGSLSVEDCGCGW